MSLMLIEHGVLGQVSQFLPQSHSNFPIIHHRYYSLAYSEAAEQAQWVAYELTKNMLLGMEKRNNSFLPDPLVVTESAFPSDYIGSGYDRGHLVPAGDMKINSEAMRETFYMSNISPQHPSFNRGQWQYLEDKVRGWAVEKERIYVVAGPILSTALPTIGTNRVAIPTHFFKIILAQHAGKTNVIAFLMPNRELPGPLSAYLTTVNDLEVITGIDFFPQLPDEQEEALESIIDAQPWHIE